MQARNRGGWVAEREPAVGDLGNAAQEVVAGGRADPYRDRLRDRAAEADVLDVVITALESHVGLGPEAAQQGDLLVHATAAIVEVGAKGAVLERVPADADAEDEAAAT